MNPESWLSWLTCSRNFWSHNWRASSMLLFMSCYRLSMRSWRLQSWGRVWPQFHGLFPRSSPGSYGKDSREVPSRLWQEEGKSNPSEMHSEPLRNTGQLCGEKLWAGHCSHVNPLQPLVSMKNEVMGANTCEGHGPGTWPTSR